MSINLINQLNQQTRAAPRLGRQTLSRVIACVSLAAIIQIGLIGCAATPSTLALLPVTGGKTAFQIHEYAIVEQSVDSPNHPEFQERVQNVVALQESGWHFPGPSDVTQGTNEALASFGYHLAANPTPPFSAYALYHDNTLIQRDIARFWPVSLKDPEAGNDFLLAFETMNGDKRFASADGLHPWPAGMTDASTPPVYYGDQVAFAQTAGSEVNVYAGAGVLYSGTLPGSRAETAAASAVVSAVRASNLHSWGKNHWALELNGDVIVDGKDLNAANGYDSVFAWQVINGQPFYFYTRGGVVHLNYAGRDLPYTYDQVLHGIVGNNAIYNPGSSRTSGSKGQIIWYYALRDGVWYYVEAGLTSK